MNHEITPVVERQKLRPLDQVRSGMSVYDSTGQRIGEVSYVYLGATMEQETERGTGPARDLAIEQDNNNSFVEALSEAFYTEEMPEEMLARLRQHGFVRIDTSGLFADDRFVSAEQIASVEDGKVRLSVNYEDMGTLQ